MRSSRLHFCGRAVVLASAPPLVALADPPAIRQRSNRTKTAKWRDKNGDPTYKIEPDGTVDWYTFSGFRRYQLRHASSATAPTARVVVTRRRSRIR